MSKKPVSKLGPSKLGRGLSSLMADIAVPTDPVINPKSKSKKSETEISGKSPWKTLKKPSGKKVAETIRLPEVPGGIRAIPIDLLERNPAQPRKHFDRQKLAELSQSIAQNGVLQPILVRPLPASYGLKGKQIDNRYQIVAGERRWHAAQAAGLEVMPALIRILSDQEVLEIGVIENVQRTDLNPMEEALAYHVLTQQFARKQEDIAKATGKSRSHVANSLRLMNLPDAAQKYLEDGKMTAGHARAVLAAPDPQALAEVIVKNGLSVRAAEAWAKAALQAILNPETPPLKDGDVSDANVKSIENEITDHIGLKVKITEKPSGGVLSVKYKTTDQLDDLINRLLDS